MNGQIMKGIVAAFAGMLVMACSGCGGGGSGGSPQEAAKAPVVVKIDAEGDSTMHGYMVDAAGNASYAVDSQPATMQSVLGITVTNNGVDGATASSTLNATAPYTTPFSDRIKSIDAQIVIENYWINDRYHFTPAQYGDALVQWISVVRGAGKTPVLEEPNPVCADTLPNGTPDDFLAVLRTVAQQQKVLLIQQYDYIKTLDWQPMMSSCSHPGDTLYKIMGQRAAQQIAPLVKSMQ